MIVKKISRGHLLAKEHNIRVEAKIQKKLAFDREIEEIQTKSQIREMESRWKREEWERSRQRIDTLAIERRIDQLHQLMHQFGYASNKDAIDSVQAEVEYLNRLLEEDKRRQAQLERCAKMPQNYLSWETSNAF